MYRSISSGTAAVWTRLGFYGVLAGTAVWTATFAIDSLGITAVAENWEEATGGDKATLFQVASSLVDVNIGLFTATIIAYWASLAMLGLGVILSTTYPSWIGWAFAVTAAALVVVGVVFSLRRVQSGARLDLRGPGVSQHYLGAGTWCLDQPEGLVRQGRNSKSLPSFVASSTRG